MSENEIDVDASTVVALEQLSRTMSVLMEIAPEFRRLLLGNPRPPIEKPKNKQEKDLNAEINDCQQKFLYLRESVFNSFVTFLTEDGPAFLSVRKAALASAVDRLVQVAPIQIKRVDRNVDDIVGPKYWRQMDSLLVGEARAILYLTQPKLDLDRKPKMK